VLEPFGKFAEVCLGEVVEYRREALAAQVRRAGHLAAHIHRAVGGVDLDEPGGDAPEQPTQGHGLVDHRVRDPLFVRRDPHVAEQHQLGDGAVGLVVGLGLRGEGPKLERGLVGRQAGGKVWGAVEQRIGDCHLQCRAGGAAGASHLVEPADETGPDVGDDRTVALSYRQRRAEVQVQGKAVAADHAPRRPACPGAECEPVDVDAAEEVGDGEREVAVAAGDRDVAEDWIGDRDDPRDVRLRRVRHGSC